MSSILLESPRWIIFRRQATRRATLWSARVQIRQNAEPYRCQMVFFSDLREPVRQTIVNHIVSPHGTSKLHFSIQIIFYRIDDPLDIITAYFTSHNGIIDVNTIDEYYETAIAEINRQIEPNFFRKTTEVK